MWPELCRNTNPGCTVAVSRVGQALYSNETDWMSGRRLCVHSCRQPPLLVGHVNVALDPKFTFLHCFCISKDLIRGRNCSGNYKDTDPYLLPFLSDFFFFYTACFILWCLNTSSLPIPQLSKVGVCSARLLPNFQLFSHCLSSLSVLYITKWATLSVLLQIIYTQQYAVPGQPHTLHFGAGCEKSQ